jgi:hypothetical protein
MPPRALSWYCSPRLGLAQIIRKHGPLQSTLPSLSPLFQAIAYRLPKKVRPSIRSIVSMFVMFGNAHRTWRTMSGGNHADESFIFMARDVAVKDELAGDIRAEAHEQAHTTGPHASARYARGEHDGAVWRIVTAPSDMQVGP